jgi:hypothetical protein
MLAILAVLALTGSFACTFVIMWGLQRLSGVSTPAVQAPRGAQPLRRNGPPLGPDDDLAFLRELRRRIDLGHFRR